MGAIRQSALVLFSLLVLVCGIVGARQHRRLSPIAIDAFTVDSIKLEKHEEETQASLDLADGFGPEDADKICHRDGQWPAVLMGHVATMQCSGGQIISRTCTYNATWDKSPLCQCYGEGMWMSTDGGVDAKVECHDDAHDHVLSRSCLHDGTWDKAPKCQCGAVGNWPKTASDDVATYKCPSGREVTRWCKNNGEWSPEPECYM